MTKTHDCIIIGGGPAGLSAAIYMARFNRSVLVVDKGEGRASGNQINQNYLGFPKGIKASKLLELGKEQAKNFGVEFESNEIIKAAKAKGIFTLKGKKGSYRAKTLIFCTGVKDLYAAFPGLFEYLGKSLFWCIICDGYKVRNKKIVVVGHDDKATVTASQFLEFTKDITFITNCEKGSDHISEEGYARLKKAKIPVKYGSLRKAHGKRGMMEKIELDTGEVIKTDFMFSKQGYVPNGDLAASLSVILEGEGFIKADKEMRTNVEGIFAAGDVTSEAANQIATAVHQGSVAATSANDYLLQPFQKEE